MRVRVRSWSWFASRVCVRVWGPRDWKRSRNEDAMMEAEDLSGEVEKARLR